MSNATNTHQILIDARDRAERDLDTACADMRETPKGKPGTPERALWYLAGEAMDLAFETFELAQDALTEYERGARNAALRRKHAHTLRGESYDACNHDH